MRSNLPLWLALTFHELAPIVAILDLLQSQPYQWRATWQSGHRSMGSGPYWVHEGWEAEVELDISPKVTGEEEAEEWLLSSQKKKNQRRSGSSRRCRIGT